MKNELISAVFERDIPAMEKLLDSNADCNEIGEQGSTPLHVGCWNGFFEGIPLLLRHGAEIHSTNSHGETALHLCARRNFITCLEYLLSYSFDVEGNNAVRALLSAQDRWGMTALHTSIRCGSDAASLFIIQSCKQLADLFDEENPLDSIINAQDEEGETPLHDAIRAGNREIVQALLSLNPHPLIENDEGRTPIELLQNASHTTTNEEIEFLLDSYLSKQKKKWTRYRRSLKSKSKSQQDNQQLKTIQRITLMKPSGNSMVGITAVVQGATASSQKIMFQESVNTVDELENLFEMISNFFESSQIPSI